VDPRRVPQPGLRPRCRGGDPRFCIHPGAGRSVLAFDAGRLNPRSAAQVSFVASAGEGVLCGVATVEAHFT